MNLKQTDVPGKCRANRCTTDVPDTEINAENPHGLCNQHYNEWAAASRPELKTSGPRKKSTTPSGGAALAKIEGAEAIQTELEPVRTTLETMLQMAANVPYEYTFTPGTLGAAQIQPVTGLELLGELREQCRQRIKSLEARRTDITRPILESKRKIDELFKPTVQQCEAVMRTCTARLEDYERTRLAAQREAALALQTTPDDPNMLALAHGAAAPLPSQVETRVIFKYEITDENLIPREFWKIDHDLLASYISSRKGQVAIPGVKVIEDVKVVAA